MFRPCLGFWIMSTPAAAVHVHREELASRRAALDDAAPSTPAAAVHVHREELASRRAALDTGWDELRREEATFAERAWKEANESGVLAELQVLRAVDEQAQARHAERICTLEKERTRDEAEACRLDTALIRLQRVAAADMVDLAATLSVQPKHQHGSALRGPAGKISQMLVRKRELCTQLCAQADQFEIRAAQAERNAELTTTNRRFVAEAEAEVLRGRTMHRWDQKTRTLHAVELCLVEGGSCLRCIDCERRVPPLLLPLTSLLELAPTSSTGAFRGVMVPAQAWLYFSMRWGLDGGELLTHFVAATRTLAARWLLGLQEMTRRLRPAPPRLQESEEPAAGPLSRGRLVLETIRLMLAERARQQGQSPAALLLQAVRARMDDAQIARSRVAANLSAMRAGGGGASCGPPADEQPLADAVRRKIAHERRLSMSSVPALPPPPPPPDEQIQHDAPGLLMKL